MGEVHQRQGELEQAGQLYREALVVAREVGDKGAVGLLLHLLGTLAHAHAQVERAACLFAIAARLRTRSGVSFLIRSREVEVLRLIALGHTYAQIAEQLVISPRTVNAHVTSIYSKLGVTSRAATRIALDHHLA